MGPPRLLRVSCPASAQCSAGSLVLKSLTKFCSTGISKSGFFWPFESKLLWVQNLSGSLSLVYAGAAMVSDPVYSSLDEDGSSMTATVWVFDLLHPVGNGWTLCLKYRRLTADDQDLFISKMTMCACALWNNSVKLTVSAMLNNVETYPDGLLDPL